MKTINVYEVEEGTFVPVSNMYFYVVVATTLLLLTLGYTIGELI